MVISLYLSFNVIKYIKLKTKLNKTVCKKITHFILIDFNIKLYMGLLLMLVNKTILEIK